MKENQQVEWNGSWHDTPDIANVFFRTEHQAGRDLTTSEMAVGIPHVTPQVTPHVTPHVERLLAVLQGDMDRMSIQVTLALNDRKPLRKIYLQPALEAGFIAMTIPEKPKSRLQRYRLTPSGEAHATILEIPETVPETSPITPKTSPTTPKTVPERILALLKAEPTITRHDLAERIGITLSGIKYHLVNLKSAGSIRHVGSTKAGRWEVLK